MNSRAFPQVKYLPLMFALWLPGHALALVAGDVMRLHASGYTEEDLLEMIAATQSEFMLTALDVVNLKRAGISDSVVQNMLWALPLDPGGGETAEPLRLKFMQEDLELLGQNRVPEAVVVTFIETRDIAFTLDTARLTALRNAGLGLDALQLLVEKSAATVTVPMAPPPAAPILAGTFGGSAGSAPAYFHGGTGISYSSYQPAYVDYFSPQPSVLIRSSLYDPWYMNSRYGGYGGYGGYRGYGYGNDGYNNLGYNYYPGFYFGNGPNWGYSPFANHYYPHYVSGYPYSGYAWHDFQCPRGPHRHDFGHGRNGGRDRGWDRDHDRDRGSVYYNTATKPTRNDDDKVTSGKGSNGGKSGKGGKDGKGGKGGKDGKGGKGGKDGSAGYVVKNPTGKGSGGKRPTEVNFGRDTATQTPTFKVLGTKPLYGKSATTGSSAKPAPQAPVTFKSTPGSQPATGTTTVIRPAVPGGMQAPQGTVTPGSSAEARALAREEARVAGDKVSLEDRSATYKVRGADSAGRGTPDQGRARPR